jgi:7,8-dihydropterin-6-yl-methyl-4-(beta-D-ribofuranosyl)aminobenzene 5'-phosphate synthase
VAQIELEPVERVRVTILMDNVTDPLIPDQGPITRVSWPKALAPGAPRVAADIAADRAAPDVLIAEPGFSALVRVEKNGRERTLLFDTGVSASGVVENMLRLGLSLKDVEVIVLSHGHWDHVAGMEGVAKALGRPSLPALIHPEFWSRRRISFQGHDPAELPSTSRTALEGVGFEIVEERRPSFLLDGSVLITGEVDRTTEFETGFKGNEAFRKGRWEPDPLILDDQALVLSLGERGLLVLSGCGHAGIVNTLRYAQRLTGQQKLAAVIGGFHLSGPMFEPIIDPTVRAFDELSPALLVPAHCTGWKAVHQLAARFPDAFVQSAVGTTIEL